MILIHGLMSSAAMNWRLPGVIGELSKDYQVIALDLPGHGKSDKPENADAYGAQMVEDVFALMDHLNVVRRNALAAEAPARPAFST